MLNLTKKERDAIEAAAWEFANEKEYEGGQPKHADVLFDLLTRDEADRKELAL